MNSKNQIQKLNNKWFSPTFHTFQTKTELNDFLYFLQILWNQVKYEKFQDWAIKQQNQNLKCKSDRCRADIRLRQNWHCNQNWGKGSDGVLSPSLEPAESIPLTVFWGAKKCFHLFIESFQGQCTNFRNFLLNISWRITGRWLQYYHFHSSCGLCSFCTLYRSLVLHMSQNQTPKFQDLNITVKLDLLWSLLAVRFWKRANLRMLMESDENASWRKT